jgi:hypothetical protein
MILGQEYLRNEKNAGLNATINMLLKEQPDWSATDIFTYANRQLVSAQVVDSMQVLPGVVVAQAAMMGRSTRSGEGDPGTMSRDSPLNAVTRDADGAFFRPRPQVPQ